MNKSDWQPIETAPKDGTWILIFRGHDADWTFNYALVYWDDHFMCWHDGDYHSDYYRPNHWMPLSEPPSEVGNREEQDAIDAL